MLNWKNATSAYSAIIRFDDLGERDTDRCEEDFGLTFFLSAGCWPIFLDGRPLFGPSKTIRGILISVLITAASAPLIGLDLKIGAIVAAAAMAGDLFSSFVKRRLNSPPSSQALGLDQVPESLFPMLACRDALSLTIADIALGVGIFFIGAPLLSRFLFRARLRDEPY